MFAAVSLMAFTVNGVALWRQSQSQRALPDPPPSMPNVLFIIWDTVRAASMGLYGYERDNTPVLEEFAARSVVFDRAITPAPWTLAAHGSMFTGHMPWELSAGWTVPLDDTHPTLAEYLTGRGYASAAFVANYIYGPPAFGLARGFTHYRFYPLNAGIVLTSSPLLERMVPIANHALGTYWNPRRRSARKITEAFLRWHADVGERPFFAFLNLFDAHDPYVPEPPFDRRFGDPKVRRVDTGEEISPEKRTDVIDAYDGAIAAVDHELGRALEELQRRGDLDNTLVIVASDHGELFGEHRLYGHGNSLYLRELHVPLVVFMPGRVPAGLRIPATVSLSDLSATITDLLELPDAPFPGNSLARTWRTDPVEAEPVVSVVPFSPRQPEWYPISRGDMRSVIDWPMQLVVTGDGAEEFFDLNAMGDEHQNTAAMADSSRIAEMRRVLTAVPARVTAPPRR
jgi:arylsulfatase A-like enzyme